MAKYPASNILLTDELRLNCLAREQEKQMRNKKSKRNTGENSPVDVDEGVKCSDFKGPIAPRDRLRNCYMVNFIDHRTNYCSVNIAKTKDVAA